MSKHSFRKSVFAKTKLIPRGKVSTYKLLAKAIGRPRAGRAVGNALNKNCESKVPCHRVVRSPKPYGSGRSYCTVGGFRDGEAMKIKILQKEGLKIINGKIPLEKYLYRF